MAKDLVESYGDIVQEVFGYGPLEVLGQGPLEVLGQDGGDKLKSDFIFYYVARARAIARMPMPVATGPPKPSLNLDLVGLLRIGVSYQHRRLRCDDVRHSTPERKFITKNK